ncbi:RecQ family ATP-dependent DNA helicase [Virgibacillus siamensis]|uniref:RecQ family ATP-dependent DNA helicase n=1 Tax=Virgibacillus siamensis TaxID=480071 RepID=UPI00098458B0|nr:ATP-dependent DNA helicase RecQ [Virgibacillus siamensis]
MNLTSQATLDDKLKTQFRINSFRPGQKEIIEDVLQGKDVLGILPTGSGKSLCYQLPAAVMGGLTIVVSPLISLMQDQVKQLRSKGFKRTAALNSFMEPQERKHVFRNIDAFHLIYISPELLQQRKVIDLLRQVEISLFVIDEAHCISQWGHDFRPDYLRLGRILEQLKNPPVLALSATATEEIQRDIIAALNRGAITKHIHPIDKNNITFSIEHVNGNIEKKQFLADLFKRYRVPTLIYFTSRRMTEETAQYLTEVLPSHRIAFYHGGMDQSDRVTIQQQFMNDQLDIICCTSAFGMGINKHNIRLVIHYHLPVQLESYIQEVGRAGRDGEQSIAFLLYSNGDEQIPESIIESELPSSNALSAIFRRLTELCSVTTDLAKIEEQLTMEFELNEIQWRFLHYQFENHDMIKKNKLIVDSEQWNEAKQRIDKLITERKHVKERKLREIMGWINQQECLRRHLYKNFQDTYEKVESMCCSNCGFSLRGWEPKQTAPAESTPTWQKKLSEILLNGEHHDKAK